MVSDLEHIANILIFFPKLQVLNIFKYLAVFAFFFFLLIEDDWKKEYVPVPIPVPVYVPVPMNMYSQNVPVPTTVPVPVSETSVFKLASVDIRVVFVVVLAHLKDCRMRQHRLLTKH